MKARLRVKPYGTTSPAVEYSDLRELDGEDAVRFPKCFRTWGGDYIDIMKLRIYRRQTNDPDKYVIETDDLPALAEYLGISLGEPGIEEWRQEKDS